jgi:hypothetical protein
MAQKTANQQAEELSDNTKLKLRDWALAGKTIVYMVEKTGIAYPVIQTYLWQSGNLPWKGAKNIIARRLRSLSTATRRQSREDLVDDIRGQVDYLYYAACHLRDQLDKVKKSLR